MIDFIIPIYNPNKDRFINLLKTIQNQIDKDFEVYFINDFGSTDFKNLVKENLTDISYTFIDLDHNVGQGLARQAALDVCKGEWVTFIDQDDTISVNMVKSAKKIIKDTECPYVVSTKSVVANNNNWINTNEFGVEDSVSVLHGKFYNLEKIRKFNIHFTEKVRAHEDTFFQSLVYSYLALDDELNSNERSYVESDIITYFWYLWDDSTSHTRYFDSTCLSKIGYLEKSIGEYVTAIIEAYKEVKTKCKVNDDFKYSRFCSFLYFLYWFTQSFEYFNPIGWKKDNLIHIKRARDFVMSEFNMKEVSEITNLLLDIPDMYYSTFNEVFTNVGGYFVPRLTIEQFYQTLENRIAAFNIKET